MLLYTRAKMKYFQIKKNVSVVRCSHTHLIFFLFFFFLNLITDFIIPALFSSNKNVSFKRMYYGNNMQYFWGSFIVEC